MNKEKFFLGYPVEFEHICLVYPPKVGDVVGNNQYNIYLSLLTQSKESIEDAYVEKGLDPKDALTPFEYILNNVYNTPGFEQMTKKAFEFFLHEEVTFLPTEKLIIVGDLKESLKIVKDITQLRFINEENFFDLQNLIRLSCNQDTVSRPDPNEHPKIKAMKAKARYRDRIKAKQGLGLNLESSLTSICCMNLGLNPLNIRELSYCALSMLMRRFQEKEKYQTDIDSLLAGADSKKIKPKYWIRNLED